MTLKYANHEFQLTIKRNLVGDIVIALKVKRFPSGLICKLKAWFCVYGDQIPGIDFDETYASVVS